MAQQKLQLPPPCQQPAIPVRPPKPLGVSPINLSHFSWSDEEMGMKQFVSAAILHAKGDVESNLMILCRVTEGYQGCDLWHEFSSDEVNCKWSCFIAQRYGTMHVMYAFDMHAQMGITLRPKGTETTRYMKLVETGGK